MGSNRRNVGYMTERGFPKTALVPRQFFVRFFFFKDEANFQCSESRKREIDGIYVTTASDLLV